MSVVAVAAAAVATTAVDPERVTPGIGGFLVFFLLGLFSWFLYRSFSTHMRRVDVRARRQAEQDAAARDATGDGAASSPPPATGVTQPEEDGAPGARDDAR